ncbi:unnamed protein product [Trichobilharzia szidati]|nr:unnamed protein product [Trichobilharzia szidati]
MNNNNNNSSNISSDEIRQVHKLTANESLFELNNMTDLNKSDSSCTSLSFTYSSTGMKMSSFVNEQLYCTPSEIRSKSCIMIPRVTTCTSCSTSSSSCCYSSSMNSLNNAVNRTSFSSDILMNPCYGLPQNEFSHAYHQNQTFSPAFNNNSETNQKIPLDNVQCDQYSTDVQYSTNQYQKIWGQSSETQHEPSVDRCNLTDSSSLSGTEDPLNKLQAWLKSPFEECDMKWNSQFLENTIKFSKGTLSPNCEPIVTTANKTGSMFNELSAPSASTITECVSCKAANNSVEHLATNESKPYQYHNNLHHQLHDNIFTHPNDTFTMQKFMKSSGDYLNTNVSKQKVNVEEKVKLTDKSEPHKRSIKYNGHIKKPLNAFMLFMKEMRAQVIAECTLKESAAINQILGRKWHALTREAQAKYYKLAKQEKEIHQRLYPGWSARDNYATQVRRRSRATKLSRNIVTTTPVTGNSNTSGSNSSSDKIYATHSFPDSEFWYSSNNRNNTLSHNNSSSNSSNSSVCTQQFPDSHLPQTLNSSFTQTYSSLRTQYELFNTNAPMNKVDAPLTPNYNQPYNFDQLTKMSLSKPNYCLNYRQLLSSNAVNNPKELNTLQPFTENQYSQVQSSQKSMKPDYPLHSLSYSNYETTVGRIDDSSLRDRNVPLIYEIKNPVTPTSSVEDHLNLRSDISYLTESSSYTEEGNNAPLNLWQNNESITHQDASEYSCYPNSHLGFYPSNDCSSPKFTDSLQHCNTKSDVLGFESMSEIQQHRNYFRDISYLQGNHQNTDFIKYFQTNPYITSDDAHLQSSSNAPLSSCQVKSNDSFISPSESSFAINAGQLNSKSTDHKYAEQYFSSGESIHKQTTKLFTPNSNESLLL